MNVIIKISTAIMMVLAFSSCDAQVNNAKTETVNIYGNCGMCEKAIEKAGNINKVVKVDWDKDTKMATLIYDSTKTNQDEILKRIALVGYDSDKFFAPDDVYNKLVECCQYERVNKTAITQAEVKEDHTIHSQKTQVEVKEDHSMHNQITVVKNEQTVNQLKMIFENYFTLKDALVKSDSKLASTLAKDMLSLINAVKMDKLSQEEHTVWMKVVSSLKLNTDKISATSNVDSQRNIFMTVSAKFYDLLKVSKQETPVYYQHCPMYNDGEGANWLSKENAVKNPYYGSQMLSCGKTVETIK